MRSGKILRLVSVAGFLAVCAISLKLTSHGGREAYPWITNTKSAWRGARADLDAREPRISAGNQRALSSRDAVTAVDQKASVNPVAGSTASMKGKTKQDESPSATKVPSPVRYGGPTSVGSSLNATGLAGMFDFVAPEGVLVGRAYWMEKRLIVAVMLRQSHNLPQVCKYQGKSASSVRYLSHLGDMHAAKIPPLAAFCTFAEDTDAPANGVGELTIVEDGYKIPVYDFRPKIAEPMKWVVCFPPLHLKPRYVWVDQMLKYYVRKLRPDHFFMYTSIEGQSRRTMREEMGVEVAMTHASVLNLASQQSYKPYYFGQTFAVHDCLFMNRQAGTKWVVFQDYDEILTPPAGLFPTVFDFFENHREHTAITLGTWPVDVVECRPQSFVKDTDRDWPLLVRMHDRHKKPYCGQLCRNWQGRRKYALQPAGHERLFVHDPLGGKVFHMPVDDGFLLHYWSVQDTGMHYCEQIVPVANSTATVQ